MKVEAGADLRPLVKALTQEKIDRYAEVQGDFNPLHTDPEFAARSQFGGTVAHGMLILAYLSGMLTAAFGRSWLESGRLKVHLRGPARPGDTLTIGGRVLQVSQGRATCEVEVRNQRQEILVSGRAEVKL